MAAEESKILLKRFCVACYHRFARGGHCIEGASGAVVNVGGLNRQHAMSVGAARLRYSLGVLQVDLRTQVAHETGYLGEARVLGQEEKHAAAAPPSLALGYGTVSIDFLVVGVGPQEGKRRYDRAGTYARNAIELWQRVRAGCDCCPTQKKSCSKRAAVAATRDWEKIKRGIWVAPVGARTGSAHDPLAVFLMSSVSSYHQIGDDKKV